MIKYEHHVLYWPDEEEREGLELEDLKGCIGIMDGTDVKLEDAPSLDKESYYDKNKVNIMHSVHIDTHANFLNSKHFIGNNYYCI